MSGGACFVGLRSTCLTRPCRTRDGPRWSLCRAAMHGLDSGSLSSGGLKMTLLRGMENWRCRRPANRTVSGFSEGTCMPQAATLPNEAPRERLRISYRNIQPIDSTRLTIGAGLAYRPFGLALVARRAAGHCSRPDADWRTAIKRMAAIRPYLTLRQTPRQSRTGRAPTPPQTPDFAPACIAKLGIGCLRARSHGSSQLGRLPALPAWFGPAGKWLRLVSGQPLPSLDPTDIVICRRPRPEHGRRRQNTQAILSRYEFAQIRHSGVRSSLSFAASS